MQKEEKNRAKEELKSLLYVVEAASAMGDDQLQGVRRESTASRKTAFSDSGHRKPASIYEINDLYSALQELVNSSPRPLRRRRGTGSNFDSSDSMTSGADSPDVRTKTQNDRRTMRVARSASNITRRYVVCFQCHFPCPIIMETSYN